MRTMLATALSFLFILNLSFAKDFETKRKVGDYEVDVKMDRNPPGLGDNQIEIKIKESSGKSVTDAKVLVNYYMPPMPRMVPMNYKIDAKLKGEKYVATMNFIMTGPWIIAIKITAAGKTLTTKVNVDAQ